MRAAAWAPLLLLALVGCGAPDHDGTSDRAAVPPTTVAPAPSGRQLTDTERAAMLATLGAEQGSVRKVWFALAPGDSEAAALKDALEGVFKQAGWETATQTVTGMVLKPGLSILIADEDPPPYVTTAQQALEATAFEWKTGTGYRPYFEERRRADPKWPGIALEPDQDFVVVVGPMPPAP
jgi:hypothetical protein